MTGRIGADTEELLQRARAFLHSRRTILYGQRNIFFRLEKCYRTYDGMLKRNILHTRFAVMEGIAEARLEHSGLRCNMTVQRLGSFLPSPGSAGNLAQFAASKGLTAYPGHPRKSLELQGRPFGIECPGLRTDYLELQLEPLPLSTGQKHGYLPRTRKRAWFHTLLAEWVSADPSLVLEGYPEPLTRTGDHVWTISRRISSLDLDMSGENPSDVFRWKETSLANASTYAELDDMEIASSLRSSNCILPKNARLQARMKESLSKSSSCLLLRYAHLLPDPDALSDPGPAAFPAGPGSKAPLWKNHGYLDIEGDYLEFLIDATSRQVFSEARKWRSDEMS